MTYLKPQLLSTRTAAAAIESAGKTSSSNEGDQPSETPAYEADE